MLLVMILILRSNFKAKSDSPLVVWGREQKVSAICISHSENKQTLVDSCFKQVKVKQRDDVNIFKFPGTVAQTPKDLRCS